MIHTDRSLPSAVILTAACLGLFFLNAQQTRGAAAHGCADPGGSLGGVALDGADVGDIDFPTSAGPAA